MTRLREALHRIFGPIFHPGAPRENAVAASGPTSRKLPAGEHVWSAAEVRSLGGHRSIQAIRARAAGERFARKYRSTPILAAVVAERGMDPLPEAGAR